MFQLVHTNGTHEGCEVAAGSTIHGAVSGVPYTFERVHTFPSSLTARDGMLSVRDANGRKSTIAAASFEVAWIEVADTNELSPSDTAKVREVIANGGAVDTSNLDTAHIATVASFAREVAADCDWNEGSFDVALHELTHADIVRNMARHYDGGMIAMVRDALADLPLDGSPQCPLCGRQSHGCTCDDIGAPVRVMFPHAKVEPVIGAKVANGSTVVAVKACDPSGFIVLCLTAMGSDPYATWRAYDDGMGAIACVHGHYFASLADAVADFEGR